MIIIIGKQLGFHSVAVVLTLVQTKQKRIYEVFSKSIRTDQST